MNDFIAFFYQLYNFISIIITMFIVSIFNRVKSIDWNELKLSGFLFYCRTVTTVKQNYNDLCENNELVRDIASSLIYIFKYVVACLLDRRIETNHEFWFSNSCLVFNDYNLTNHFIPGCNYKLTEYFVHMYDDDMIETSKLDYLQTWYNIVLKQSETDKTTIDNLFTIKDKKYRHYRICNEKNKEIPTSLSTEVSDIRFISIEIHMPVFSNKPYIIEIEPTAYLVDNVLFTPAFVKRYMEYYVDSVTFDMNYKIKIMDNNIHSFELDSTQYLVLGKDGYTIHSNA